jgi:peptidyl-Asp metalloendopeptidase
MAISDFNNDGFSDIQWYNANTHEVGYWSIVNGAIAGWTPQADFAFLNFQRLGNGDYDSDGFADTMWRSVNTGELGWWNIDAGVVQSWTSFGIPNPYFPLAAERSDLTGDGADDVLFFKYLGAAGNEIGFWDLENGGIASWTSFGVVPGNLSPVATGNFSGDGHDDLLWFNASTREVGFWDIDNGSISSWNSFGIAPANWSPSGRTADFTNDGSEDILWLTP